MIMKWSIFFYKNKKEKKKIIINNHLLYKLNKINNTYK